MILLCCGKHCLSIAQFGDLLPLDYKPFVDHLIVVVVAKKSVIEVTVSEDILRKIGEAVGLYPGLTFSLCR